MGVVKLPLKYNAILPGQGFALPSALRHGTVASLGRNAEAMDLIYALGNLACCTAATKKNSYARNERL
jgi:hypothetical protein